jgi:threonine dehydratase
MPSTHGHPSRRRLPEKNPDRPRLRRGQWKPHWSLPKPEPRLHNTVLLKREDQQPVRSFKLRGAYNKMAHLTPEQLQKGVICASAGNHAQGVA